MGNIGIIGAGSIGCLWAAKLSQSGHSPTLILRNERYKQLGKQSIDLVLTDIKGHSHRYEVPITDAGSIDSAFDGVIVCTKAQQAKAAIAALPDSAFATHTHLLLLQNGLGSQHDIAQAYPFLAVWAGSITDGAYLEDVFHVRHAGVGKTWIGPLNPLFNNEAVFTKILHTLSLDIEFTPDIASKLWEKLAINCCINGLTALYNCKNGELLDNAAREQHLNTLIEETDHCLTRLGRKLPFFLNDTVKQVCRQTASNISSTCQDFRANKPSELSYINQFLIQEAEKHCIPLHTHTQLLLTLNEPLTLSNQQ